MLLQGVTNFAVYSSAATAVSLVLFTEADLQVCRRCHPVSRTGTLYTASDGKGGMDSKLQETIVKFCRLGTPHTRWRWTLCSIAAETPGTLRCQSWMPTCYMVCAHASLDTAVLLAAVYVHKHMCMARSSTHNLLHLW